MEDDPAMSGVRKEEREEGVSTPGLESLDAELLEEVKPEDTPPTVTAFIKEEATTYELNGLLIETDVVGVGVKVDGAVQKQFGEEGGLKVEAPDNGSLLDQVDEIPPKENRLADDGAAAAKDGNTVPALLLGITRSEEALPRVDQSDTAGEGYDEDGPPPGWEAVLTKDACDLVPPVSVEITPLEIKMEEAQPAEGSLEAADRECDDGPLPVWVAALTKDTGALVPHVSLETSPMEIRMEETQPAEEKLGAADRESDDGPPPGWEAGPTSNGRSGEAAIKQLSSKLGKCKEKEAKRLPPGWESGTAHPLLLPYKDKAPTTEMGQVVCGSCRSLLSYSRGAKYIQCLCCQTVSFVLEAHQVGQVYCGKCSVLLMYFYGSSAVRCSCCQFITQIGPDNRRPPLSEQGVTLQSQLAQLCPATNHGR